MAAIADAAGHPEPARAARALCLVRDGAMVGGYLDDPDSVRVSLVEAARAVIAV
jgi:hypothetical protein